MIKKILGILQNKKGPSSKFNLLNEIRALKFNHEVRFINEALGVSIKRARELQETLRPLKEMMKKTDSISQDIEIIIKESGIRNLNELVWISFKAGADWVRSNNLGDLLGALKGLGPESLQEIGEIMTMVKKDKKRPLLS